MAQTSSWYEIIKMKVYWNILVSRSPILLQQLFVAVAIRHPLDYNTFMLRVLIIYSTHILCFFMCSYFLCLLLLTQSQNPRHPLLRAEIVTQGTRKSNNFNCILCFWLNYFFSLSRLRRLASYVSHLIVRVRGEYLGCFREIIAAPSSLDWNDTYG